MIRLNEKPFYLDEEGIAWVNHTLAQMTVEEKVGQLFCPLGFSREPAYLDHLINDMYVGGLLYRPGTSADIRSAHKYIQDHAKIPFLLAANTENGGAGLTTEGTTVGKPMNVAATGDPENAYRMGFLACSEGAALGLNWSFAPIVDIDYNFHNPITNVRTFGSDPDMVLKCGRAYLRGADEANVAVAVKHFPGDGCDERDQHLLTSINSLSCDGWDDSYGKIYRGLIEDGAKTVMVGHIAQPAYVKKLNPAATREECLYPATLSPELLTGLLRGKLGFNGMITTDSSCMVGFSDAMPRHLAIPRAVMSGCDMILFNKDLEEDFGFLMAALEDGRLTRERLDEAVTRILATKASLGLHVKQKKGTLVPDETAGSVIGCEKFREWAEQIADESVTLVRDENGILPISPKKYKRVYLNVVQKNTNMDDSLVKTWKELFEKEGFEVTVRDRSVTVTAENLGGVGMTPEITGRIHEMYRSIGEFRESTDLYVYIAFVENSSNNTTTRLNWKVTFGLGDDLPWFTQEKDTLFISVANPYHLFDVPMVKTYINAYDTTPAINCAVMDKIMGRRAFKGKSPVDPFCGNPYLSGNF